MRWTERQRAMLREMGVQMWQRDGSMPASPAASGEDVAVAEPAAVGPTQSPRPSPPRPAPAMPLEGEAEWQAADWLIVGEPFEAVAPGTIAVAGDQRRLLANMLQAIGVSRSAPARTGRACHFALVEGNRQHLDAVLQRVCPRLILALGRTAAEALLGVDEPLGRLRGQVHEHAGSRIVVSFPLAYLLRNPSEKAKAWADLCLAVRALEADAA
jgi:uracil-DNA glycosylase family 4